MKRRHLFKRHLEDRANARTRRDFFKAAAGAAAACNFLGGSSSSAATGRATGGAYPMLAPAGELSTRLQITQE
jgi:hypothetical protein